MADIPTRIARVELRCSNVEASAELYARLIGLELTRIDHDEALLRAPQGEEPILVLRRAERPGRAPRRASGLFHSAFRYPTRASLAAALGRIAELGVELSGVADHGASEALYLDDPDGLGIELYRDRPISDWPAPGPGERVRLYTAPLDLIDLGAAAGPGVDPRVVEQVEIGHLHLRVAEVGAAERFWTEQLGMETMTRMGEQAAFLAWGGYHHHIGVNSWHSRGAEREPMEGPGLDRVAVLAEPPADPDQAQTPDGIPVETVSR